MSEPRYQADAEVVTCELEGGAALLDLRTSTYFSLNPVASVVWEAMSAPVELEVLCEKVSDRFSVSAAACRDDVSALLAELRDRGLANRLDAV